LIHVDASSAVPMQVQIQTGFKELVVKGLLKPGDPMPRPSELAEKLFISPATVVRAYQDMEKQGFLNGSPNGYTVSDRAWSQSTQNLVDALQQFLESLRYSRRSGLEWKDLESILQMMKSKESSPGSKTAVPEILKELRFFARQGATGGIALCPYCRASVSDQEIACCFVCGTAHHAECWNESGHCSVFGCEGKTPFQL
jgi:GntR family transcriptional regulator